MLLELSTELTAPWLVLSFPEGRWFLMKKVHEYFAQILDNPEKPFLANLGGAKNSDKIKLIDHLLDKVNSLIICGCMAFTFKMTLEGVKIGNSLSSMRLEHKMLETSWRRQRRMVLRLCCHKLAANAQTDSATDGTGIPDGWIGPDCGPESIKLYQVAIEKAKTILWNGPCVFEFEKFADGTKATLRVSTHKEYINTGS
ncbi:phosphoglycerate kinase [Terfezia boudieri ATCC MYA-4762]|uniref:Phosphoglycerate kinase n=1 Tax=Terfezia boudieri ATCC MYA-4762 TaxID=1051890 RepID=A0A3N4LBY9_9PEZI|nr:phosphoglycerate kinase [Terfezia boudieri ATCC MYA-4762]